jgi:ankyrin repeat protein
MSQPLVPTDITKLQSLPPEIVTPILLQLPLTDLRRVCQVSTYLRSFCQSWDFWADRAAQEFKFPRNLFKYTTKETPRQHYDEIPAYLQNPTNFLVETARNNYPDLLHYLIQIGTPTQDQLNAALYEAAKNGHSSAVQELINAGTDIRVNAKDLNPLQIAIKNGKSNIVQALIQGARNRQTARDVALYFAARYGQVSLVRSLLQAGADDLNSALMAAATTGQVGIVQLLSQAGATDLNDPLIQAAYTGNLPATQTLIAVGATDVEAALLEAAAQGHLPVVMELIQSGTRNLGQALVVARYFLPNSAVVAYLEDLIESLRSRVIQSRHNPYESQ